MTVLPVNKVIVFFCPSSSAFLRHHSHLAITAARNNTVHVVLAFDDNVCKSILENHGITVYSMRVSRKSANPMRVICEVRAFRRLLRKLKPDIVNAINLKAVLVAALANIGATARLVGTVPGLGYMFSGNRLRQRLLRMATVIGLRFGLACQDHVLIFSNRDDANDFTSRGIANDAHFSVIPVPGVDTSVFTAVAEPKTGFRVVLPARMLWDKGVGEFVTAARELKSTLPEVELLLAGLPDPGNPESIPDKVINEWVAEGIVDWLGDCLDMPGLFASCHVVCLPSKFREGFPRVLVEAMACGRAIITTDVPGCREINPDIGIVVTPGDAVKIAAGIKWLHDNPQERQERGLRGRKKAIAEFDICSITELVLRRFNG